jgi:hypothetical protein
MAWHYNSIYHCCLKSTHSNNPQLCAQHVDNCAIACPATELQHQLLLAASCSMRGAQQLQWAACLRGSPRCSAGSTECMQAAPLHRHAGVAQHCSTSRMQGRRLQRACCTHDHTVAYISTMPQTMAPTSRCFVSQLLYAAEQ